MKYLNKFNLEMLMYCRKPPEKPEDSSSLRPKYHVESGSCVSWPKVKDQKLIHTGDLNRYAVGMYADRQNVWIDGGRQIGVYVGMLVDNRSDWNTICMWTDIKTLGWEAHHYRPPTTTCLSVFMIGTVRNLLRYKLSVY